MQTPETVQELFNKAINWHQNGSINQALDLYKQLLVYDPNNSHILFLLGTGLYQIGAHSQGIQHLKQSLSVQPNPLAYNNLGVIHLALHQNKEAVESFEMAVQLDPNYAEGYWHLGAALRATKDYKKSIDSCKKATLLSPSSEKAFFNLANTLHDIKMYRDAISAYNKSIELNPEFSDAYAGMALSLFELAQYEEALTSYNKAINKNPSDPYLFYNKGKTLAKLQRISEAIDAYGVAITMKNDYVEAYNNRGLAQQEANQLSEAYSDLSKAFAINPDFTCLLGSTLYLQMRLCDWNDLDAKIAALEQGLRQTKNIAQPFVTQALIDNPLLQKSCAETFIKKEFPEASPHQLVSPTRDSQRIKIAYFSSDFGNHPVSHLLSSLFERHDRSKFEIFAFALKDRTDDEWKARIEAGVEHYINVCGQSDLEVAALARSLGIDIAIDLNGHTKYAKTGIFAQRAAPIQASYIGFLGTMGAPYFDYLIADNTLVPEHMQEFYSEKIVYLPSYQYNDKRVDTNDIILAREQYGLPKEGFVYCSFNNNYKITPTIFNAWMEILSSVNNSVLWLYVDNLKAQENLLTETERRGIAPCRLVFAEKIPLEAHLARLKLADLFLDTYPYNAGATASNALRTGLPMVTLKGNSFQARYGASLLSALDLPELITSSIDQYKTLAIELATNMDFLRTTKTKLTNNLLTQPLFNPDLFIRHLEAGFIAMHDRYVKDLPPVHMHV